MITSTHTYFCFILLNHFNSNELIFSFTSSFFIRQNSLQQPDLLTALCSLKLPEAVAPPTNAATVPSSNDGSSTGTLPGLVDAPSSGEELDKKFDQWYLQQMLSNLSATQSGQQQSNATDTTQQQALQQLQSSLGNRNHTLTNELQQLRHQLGVKLNPTSFGLDQSGNCASFLENSLIRATSPSTKLNASSNFRSNLSISSNNSSTNSNASTMLSLTNGTSGTQIGSGLGALAAAAAAAAAGNVVGNNKTLASSAASQQQQQILNSANNSSLIKGKLATDNYANSRTRIRTSFDPELELPKLHRWFNENQHPSRPQIQQYVKELNSLDSRRGRKPLDVNNVVYWFKNARAAHKRYELKLMNGSIGPSGSMNMSQSMLNTTASNNSSNSIHHNNHSNSGASAAAAAMAATSLDSNSQLLQLNRRLSLQRQQQQQLLGQLHLLNQQHLVAAAGGAGAAASNLIGLQAANGCSLDQLLRNGASAVQALNGGSSKSEQDDEDLMENDTADDETDEVCADAGSLRKASKSQLADDDQRSLGSLDGSGSDRAVSQNAPNHPNSLRREHSQSFQNESRADSRGEQDEDESECDSGRQSSPFAEQTLDLSVKANARKRRLQEDHDDRSSLIGRSSPLSPASFQLSKKQVSNSLLGQSLLLNEPTVAGGPKSLSERNTSSVSQLSPILPNTFCIKQEPESGSASGGACNSASDPLANNNTPNNAMINSDGEEEYNQDSEPEMDERDYYASMLAGSAGAAALANGLVGSVGAGNNLLAANFLNSNYLQQTMNDLFMNRLIASQAAAAGSSNPAAAAAAAAAAGASLLSNPLGQLIGVNGGSMLGNGTAGAAGLNLSLIGGSATGPLGLGALGGAGANAAALAAGGGLGALSGTSGLSTSQCSAPNSNANVSMLSNPDSPDDASARRIRRSRTFIDPISEVPRLEQWFQNNTHPTHTQIVNYTDELNQLPYRQKFPKLEAKNIQFWFKNRRAKYKRLSLPTGIGSGVSSGGSGLSGNSGTLSMAPSSPSGPGSDQLAALCMTASAAPSSNIAVERLIGH